MNWLSALNGAEAPKLEGTLRYHICADDKDEVRAQEKQAARDRCRAYYAANKEKVLAQKKKAREQGVGGSSWNKGLQIAPRIPCKQCGKAFYAPPSALKRGDGKFCGRKCWAKSLRK